MSESGPRPARTISVTVQGVPPKKDGAMSLWGKPVEIARLKALRAAVSAAMDGAPLFSAGVGLRLVAFAKPRSGDLDDFLTGICDGLMARHPRTFIAEAAWSDVPSELHPDHPVAFVDDVIIALIEAERRPPPAAGEYYTLTLEELP